MKEVPNLSAINESQLQLNIQDRINKLVFIFQLDAQFLYSVIYELH
jgi:hypothetical protein